MKAGAYDDRARRQAGHKNIRPRAGHGRRAVIHQDQFAAAVGISLSRAGGAKFPVVGSRTSGSMRRKIDCRK